MVQDEEDEVDDAFLLVRDCFAPLAWSALELGLRHAMLFDAMAELTAPRLAALDAAAEVDCEAGGGRGMGDTGEEAVAAAWPAGLLALLEAFVRGGLRHAGLARAAAEHAVLRLGARNVGAGGSRGPEPASEMSRAPGNGLDPVSEPQSSRARGPAPPGVSAAVLPSADQLCRLLIVVSELMGTSAVAGTGKLACT